MRMDNPVEDNLESVWSTYEGACDERIRLQNDSEQKEMDAYFSLVEYRVETHEVNDNE
jgi:lipocalin